MAEQLFLAVKDKILYMKGAYSVAVICKSPVNNLFLPPAPPVQGWIRFTASSIPPPHWGINVLQEPLHPGRAVQLMWLNTPSTPTDNPQLLSRSHDLPHAP